MKKRKITEKTTLAEVLSQKKFISTLKRYQIPCLSCPFAQLEMNHLTLGQIAKIYHLKLGKLLQELNQISLTKDD